MPWIQETKREVNCQKMMDNFCVLDFGLSFFFGLLQLEIAESRVSTESKSEWDFPLHTASEPSTSLEIPFVYLHKALILLVVVRGSGMYDLFS